MTHSPVIVLGVSRSGTTLLKQMLDRHPQLAIPTESYFLPQLWDRHGERPDREAFLGDLDRLARLRDWGIGSSDVDERLPATPSFAEAIEAIYRAYADARKKPRFGDKTPSYMQRLDVLERAFPEALYVHLIRDGRDAALSFLALTRKARFNPARPRTVGSFAAQWRREVEDARRFGRERVAGRYHEMGYGDLVTDPEGTLRDTCEFLGLEFDPAMLEYHRATDAGTLRDHPRLAEPPTPGLRSWRDQMPKRQVQLFEAVAGELLSDLGYERAHQDLSAGARARGAFQRALFAVRVKLWDTALALVRKSPIWRLRQVYIRRTFEEGASP
jgi:Sulfotransferase family